jgi:hypothetical protein
MLKKSQEKPKYYWELTANGVYGTTEDQEGLDQNA